MSDEKRDVVVPEGMLNAVTNSRIMIPGMHAPWAEDIVLQILEVALRWQRDNPPVPTMEQINSIRQVNLNGPDEDIYKPQFYCREWMRRMYDAPEPEVPEEIKDLLHTTIYNMEDNDCNKRIIESYRRGQKSGR